MENCIFCKIVKGEIPCYKIYEDTEFIAFLDIYPRTRGHIQLIPKKHYRWAYDMEEDVFARAWMAVHKITKAVNRALNPSFVSYMTFGRQVAHAHLWIIPRYDNVSASLEVLPEVQKMQDSELAQVAKLIREQL